MKFSWKLINTFINLQKIQINKVEEQVTLSGIEVEEIEHLKKIQDNILNVSLTTNRKELCSTINLAIEIGAILNKSLKILPIKFSTIKKNTNQTKYHTKDKKIYISISPIHNIQKKNIPIWLKYYLKVYNIKSTNNIYNIQKYIEIKWGVKFDILNTNQLNNINVQQFKFINLMNTKKNKNKLFIFMSNENFNKNIKNQANICEDYYYNAYIDTIKLISTLTGCVHGKPYHYYKFKENDYKKIEINKNEINTILGTVDKQNAKYLSTKNIISSLQQLSLFQKHDVFLQRFVVKIPSNREHDLQRKIDIIEEIGRINGFNKFYDKLPLNNNKGYVSRLSIKIKNIRRTLRQLGFNEVVNSCITNNYYSKNISNHIELYNANTQEQTELRSSIIQNLIENYNTNIKQNNHRIEIFEVGKTFQKDSNSNYIENIMIGGIIHNSNFIRDNWSDKPKYANFFHIKGIIEIILEQLNADIQLKKFKTDEKIGNIKNIQTLFHIKRRIGIYSEKSNNLIGIIGELNPLYNSTIDKRKDKVYIFEINIGQIHKIIKDDNHLQYISKVYSNYPGVKRDISLKINKNTSIQEIQNIFLEIKNSLIESIEIFNEYLNKKDGYKSIGIRITYKSYKKTLTSQDIKEIDNEINKILLNFESKA